MAIAMYQGGNSLRSTGNGTQFFTTALSPQSISVWIKAEWDGNVAVRSYVGMYGSQNILGGSGSAVQIGSRTGAGSITVWTWGGAILVNSPAGQAQPGAWTHVVYTFDGTTHRLYHQGQLIASTTNAQQAGNFDTVWLNGYKDGGTNETGNFEVDTYVYYDRELLPDEILTMFSTRGNVSNVQWGNVLRYEFDEESPQVQTTSIVNLTDYNTSLSVLTKDSTRTPTSVYTPSEVCRNLRVAL